MPSRGQRWTAEQDELLKKLYEPNATGSLSASQIATEMDCGFTRNAIIGRIHRLGLALRGQRKARPRQKRVQPQRKTTIRIVRANGNSNALRSYEAAEIERAELRCIEIEPRNLSMIDLGSGECAYPYGDGPFTFCGHPKADGSSYCFPHYALSRKQNRTIDEAVTEARRRRMRGINFRRALLEVSP
jgi:GcrA cell cycle regulator